jgi:RimJ/RimL family protein N-acetyltransferase
MDKDKNFQTFYFTGATNHETFQRLRGMYLDSLDFAQEYYLEIQIKTGTFYLITDGDLNAGYFILSTDKVLLEYFVFPEWITRMDSILGLILREFKVNKALCKSFDHALLSCCYEYQKSAEAIGILFRDYSVPSALVPAPEISIRRAEMTDEARIIAVNEEVFDHPEEVKEYIQAKQIFLYEINNNLAGFGIYSQVFSGRRDYDIGMLIVPEYRHKGYGTFIINHLVKFCLQNGWNFSAGCAKENVASRKCLEKAGFISRHRLLEFTF